MIGYAQWIADPQGSFDVAFARTGTGVYVPSFVGDRVEVYAPEPGALPLAGASALALAGLRRRFPGGVRARSE